ncbi:MAG: FkbM family methyltransferase [Acidobacteriota bacterium]
MHTGRPHSRGVSGANAAQRLLAQLRVALSGAGLERFPGARALYGLVHRVVFPGGERRVEVHGMPMWVDTRDRVIATQLIGVGEWEPSETSAFLAQLREGMCVFDVGANIGYYTLLAARTVGPSGRVYAFEPEPRNFDLLTRNVAENGATNVRLVPAAVSSEAGTVRLHLDDANFGAHSLEALSVRTRSGRSVEVRAVRLDDYVDEASGFPAGVLVKVDAQGAEALIVQGGRRLLARSRVAAVMEIWPEGLARARADAGRLLADLEDLGFRFQNIGTAEGERPFLRPAEIVAACEGRRQSWANLLLTKSGAP